MNRIKKLLEGSYDSEVDNKNLPELNKISKELYGYDYNSVNITRIQQAMVRKKWYEEVHSKEGN